MNNLTKLVLVIILNYPKAQVHAQ